MMRVMFWVLMVATVLALYGLPGNSKAMEDCQKTHSYDVCFQQLNR